MEKAKLVREIKRESLKRMEEAARSVEDFNNLLTMWDKLDANWERKQRYHGFYAGTYDMDRRISRGRGDFLDAIFGNAAEMYQLIEDFDISKLVDALRPKPKEVLYLSGLRLYTIQQIALVKGQTDRNILKMRTKMMDKLRDNLAERLFIRIDKEGIITTSQRHFLEPYCKAKAGEGAENGI